MARLSVVVPIYNVEEFLRECLDSLAGQTFGDLEVVMVNDGSTDSSAAIAAAYAERDPRFKLVNRPNGGLSAARNTGLDHATGELIAFVDSDDVVLPRAYETLVGSLDETGSDIASGNVQRLTKTGTRQARYLSEAFKQTRLKTHITRFRPLLSDRTAWNKVWRRAFFDAQGLRFPEGRIYEDIPVTLPLHFSAGTVDVIADHVYLWRFRSSGGLSITERRHEVKALMDRLQAVTEVHDWLAEHGFKEAKHWYDEVLVADDLRHYVNVLDRAGDEYRELFFERVNALLDRADADVYAPLPAIERLKWTLVRKRALPELLEVLRFQREDLPDRPPLREGRHWYGDYPYRGDARLAIPEHVYRLEQELGIDAYVDRWRGEDGTLRIGGWAYIHGVGAAHEGAQKVSLALLRPGRLRRLRYLTSAVRLNVRSVQRPDANARGGDRVSDVSWSGFEATLDPRRLKRLGRWSPGTWQLFVTVRAGGLRRARMVYTFDPYDRPRAVELPATGDLLMRARPSERRELLVHAEAAWAALREVRLDGGVLRLSGELRGLTGEQLRLELAEVDGTRRRKHPLAVDGTRWSAEIPLEEAAEELVPPDADAAEDDERTTEPAWQLNVLAGKRRLRLVVPAELATTRPAWPWDGREVILRRDAQGDALLAVGVPRARLTAARWDGEVLTVEGDLGPVPAPAELVLFSRDRHARRAFAVAAGPGGRFTATATPAAVPTLAGALPLADGRWRLCLQRAGEPDAARLIPLAPSPELVATLPLAAPGSAKRIVLAVNSDRDAVLGVGRDLADDERGGFNQQRLRRTAYVAPRSEPLTDTVVYSSFRGRGAGGSPRAIHDELVRRGAALEHVWVVRDGGCVPPPGARAVRSSGREHYEALARARYVVVDDAFPGWFERRDGQVCIQATQGMPFKSIGFEVSNPRINRNFDRTWRRQRPNWQHVLSPGPEASAVLARALELDHAPLETGLPRVDGLAGARAGELRAAARRTLGLPEEARAVLYAPTFRDQVADRRHRLDRTADLARLAAATAPGDVLLLHRHPYVVDEPGAAVRDVSGFPDFTALLAAADVLVTDYASLMADFAATGRPMLFYAYDLDVYREESRGLSIDYEATVPGPILRTAAEVGDALRDLDAVARVHADRLAAFRAAHAPLDDGAAAARVVDRVFGELTSAAGGPPAASAPASRP